ncbi:MAG: GTPase ObgE, partial [Desulfobacterales bacterium]|nr:GTPase ObgE [Desulfobacterales bacterium]
ADMLSEDELETLKQKIVEALDWKAPVYIVSAISGQGCDVVMNAISQRLMEIDRLEAEQALAETEASDGERLAEEDISDA